MRFLNFFCDFFLQLEQKLASMKFSCLLPNCSGWIILICRIFCDWFVPSQTKNTKQFAIIIPCTTFPWKYLLKFPFPFPKLVAREIFHLISLAQSGSSFNQLLILLCTKCCTGKIVFSTLPLADNNPFWIGNALCCKLYRAVKNPLCTFRMPRCTAWSENFAWTSSRNSRCGLLEWLPLKNVWRWDHMKLICGALGAGRPAHNREKTLPLYIVALMICFKMLIKFYAKFKLKSDAIVWLWFVRLNECFKIHSV